MMLAARIGISRPEWAAMTPTELHVWSKAYREKLRDEAHSEKYNSYNLASLIRAMVWAKHAPSFEAVYPGEGKNKDMSDEQMYAQVLALNKLFGGTEEA